MYDFSSLSATNSLGMSSFIWVLDSRPSNHMSFDSLAFASLSPTFSMHVMTTNDTHLLLVSIGSVITPHLSLSHVYHIPNLTLNLVSISQLYDSSYLVSYSFTSCFM